MDRLLNIVCCIPYQKDTEYYYHSDFEDKVVEGKLRQDKWAKAVHHYRGHAFIGQPTDEKETYCPKLLNGEE
jgi:hypothetical protein